MIFNIANIIWASDNISYILSILVDFICIQKKCDEKRLRWKKIFHFISSVRLDVLFIRNLGFVKLSLFRGLKVVYKFLNIGHFWQFSRYIKRKFAFFDFWRARKSSQFLKISTLEGRHSYKPVSYKKMSILGTVI